MKRTIYSVLILGLAFILSSCATAPIKPPVTTKEQIYPQTTAPALRQDISHVVAPGETLWRIAKMYDVSIDDIRHANCLGNSTKLKMGQRLLVEKAASIKPVISLYPSNKWKYIIIHHSATDEGSALAFYKFHRSRGWKNLGYHFVIDNDSHEKQDGQIEVSPRWIKKQYGTHCKAGGMNYKAIGICLVGNFNTESVSEKQMDSLVYLVNTLRKYYNISLKNIVGHGQVKGARTECPGKNFPWRSFYSKLKEETGN
ncbi:MAG: N-acetylmuramoyl-L-alanine amidase [Candidatus Omnitrophica bacterium]|nr:N-acetylmuramoyl-L-alanine amidase [Candidatus Omnitrophota bacterium]MBU4488514.1 N-acetylmuramoyl-L-alanine amidase [Candidatus Omnitrophota bacterium]MCG2704574.1 N-acetylmuramoyl-L-alanine amidase [Candidatus Omnitrophota bacterium]